LLQRLNREWRYWRLKITVPGQVSRNWPKTVEQILIVLKEVRTRLVDKFAKKKQNFLEFNTGFAAITPNWSG